MRRAQIPGVDDVDIILAHETWEMERQPSPSAVGLGAEARRHERMPSDTSMRSCRRACVSNMCRKQVGSSACPLTHLDTGQGDAGVRAASSRHTPLLPRLSGDRLCLPERRGGAAGRLRRRHVTRVASPRVRAITRLECCGATEEMPRLRKARPCDRAIWCCCDALRVASGGTAATRSGHACAAAQREGGSIVRQSEPGSRTRVWRGAEEAGSQTPRS